MMDKLAAVLMILVIGGLLIVGCGAVAKIGGDAAGDAIGRHVAQPAAECVADATCIDQRQTAVQINAGVAVGNRIEQNMTAQDESSTNGNGDNFLDKASAVAEAVTMVLTYAAMIAIAAIGCLFFFAWLAGG